MSAATRCQFHLGWMLLFMVIGVTLSLALPSKTESGQKATLHSTESQLRDRRSLDYKSEQEEDGGLAEEVNTPRITFHTGVVPPERVEAALYSSVVLECQAGGTPPPTIHWLRNGRRIEQSREDNVLVDDVLESAAATAADSSAAAAGSSGGGALGLSSTSSRLYIDCVTGDDRGQYTCVAENKYKRISTHSKLIVTSGIDSRPSSHCKIAKRTGLVSPARIYMWTTSSLDLEGASVLLFCRSTGYPQPAVRWYDPESKFIKTGGKYEILPTGDLRIRDINFMEHMGLFTCVAKNTLGQDQAETFLYPTLME